MITYARIARLELARGDVIVSTVQHRDYVLVFTEQGHVFKLMGDEDQ